MSHNRLLVIDTYTVATVELIVFGIHAKWTESIPNGLYSDRIRKIRVAIVYIFHKGKI